MKYIKLIILTCATLFLLNEISPGNFNDKYYGLYLIGGLISLVWLYAEINVMIFSIEDKSQNENISIHVLNGIKTINGDEAVNLTAVEILVNHGYSTNTLITENKNINRAIYMLDIKNDNDFEIMNDTFVDLFGKLKDGKL